MNVLLKFLFSLIAHAAWRRIGGRGAVPPVKLPKTKAPINVPVFSSWQLMAMMWLAKKVWQRHGGTVKTRLVNADNPVVRRVGSYVPDVDGATTANGSQTITAKAVHLQPATTTSSTSAPASVSASAVAANDRSYDTHRLDDDTEPLLSSLRNGTSSLPTA